MRTHINLDLRHKKIILNLSEKQEVLFGTSPKNIYISNEKEIYYVKKSKKRTAREFFKDDPDFNKLIHNRTKLFNDILMQKDFDETTEQPNNTELCVSLLATSEKKLEFENIQLKIIRYIQHVKEVTLLNIFIELVASRIIKNIFHPIVVVPENYLFIDHNEGPLLLSKSIPGFCEFIANHPVLKEATTASSWAGKNPPKFIDVITNEQQARNIGEIAAMGALMGHKDLFNNINASNGGYLQNENGHYHAAHVDPGNTLEVGFEGHTASETAAKNPQFLNGGKINIKNLFTFNYQDLTGFTHTTPFTKTVYPIPPRSLISDLFNFSSDDNVCFRKAECDGFIHACTRISMKIPHMKKLIPEVIAHTLQTRMSVNDCETITRLIPIDFAKELAKTLQGRGRSLTKICKDLYKGIGIKKIAEKQFKKIYQSQLLPSQKVSLYLNKQGLYKLKDSPSTPFFLLKENKNNHTTGINPHSRPIKKSHNSF